MLHAKKSSGTTGIALALAAAGLLSVGTSFTAQADLGDKGKTVDIVHCYGVNQCGGHNDCKTADNACAGKAGCKGHGFVTMSTKACSDLGGALKDSWRGTVAKVDLKHCYGVNQCKGHNDCKTADNACAGQAACKGHGFIATPAKACEDIGGEVGA